MRSPGATTRLRFRTSSGPGRIRRSALAGTTRRSTFPSASRASAPYSSRRTFSDGGIPWYGVRDGAGKNATRAGPKTVAASRWRAAASLSCAQTTTHFSPSAADAAPNR